MKSTRRMDALVAMVPSGVSVADIGADHGQITKKLIERGDIPFFYACDNKKGPFSALKKTLAPFHAQPGCCALKDGLDDLPLAINFVIIAGMGGELMLRILEKGKAHFSHIDGFLLSPQSFQKEVRRYLMEHGYRIVEEQLVEEEHVYELLRFEKGKAHYTDRELTYGPLLLQQKSLVFRRYYQQQKTQYLSLLQQPLSEKRRHEVEKICQELEEVLS